MRHKTAQNNVTKFRHRLIAIYKSAQKFFWPRTRLSSPNKKDEFLTLFCAITNYILCRCWHCFGKSLISDHCSSRLTGKHDVVLGWQSWFPCFRSATNTVMLISSKLAPTQITCGTSKNWRRSIPVQLETRSAWQQRKVATLLKSNSFILVVWLSDTLTVSPIHTLWRGLPTQLRSILLICM
jgi:hypothetical protein